jgi:hypothetical protein
VDFLFHRRGLNSKYTSLRHAPGPSAVADAFMAAVAAKVVFEIV